MVTSIEAEAEKAKMKIPHLTRELEEKRKSVKNVGEEFLKMQKEQTSSIQRLEQLKQQLNTLQFDEKREQQLLDQKRTLENNIIRCRQEVETLVARLNMDFDYVDPEPHFDRSKVKGFVAERVEVKDQKYNTALEVVAGAKLRNVTWSFFFLKKKQTND